MIGILVKCKEDMDIINMEVSFKKDIFYTMIEDNEHKLWVISREHTPVNIMNKDIFNRHFELKQL